MPHGARPGQAPAYELTLQPSASPATSTFTVCPEPAHAAPSAAPTRSCPLDFHWAITASSSLVPPFRSAPTDCSQPVGACELLSQAVALLGSETPATPSHSGKDQALPVAPKAPHDLPHYLLGLSFHSPPRPPCSSPVASSLSLDHIKQIPTALAVPSSWAALPPGPYMAPSPLLTQVPAHVSPSQQGLPDHFIL